MPAAGCHKNPKNGEIRTPTPKKINWQVWDSNWGPLVCKTKALPLDHGGKLQRILIFISVPSFTTLYACSN